MQIHQDRIHLEAITESAITEVPGGRQLEMAPMPALERPVGGVWDRQSEARVQAGKKPDQEPVEDQG